MTVIDLDAHRPHKTGDARCILCAHQWVAVAPLGVEELQCSVCGQLGGRFWAPYGTGGVAPTRDGNVPEGQHADLILFGSFAFVVAGVAMALWAVSGLVDAVRGLFA
jgi:hypothetical protein